MLEDCEFSIWKSFSEAAAERDFAAGRCEVEQNGFYNLCCLKPCILSNLLDYWKTPRYDHLGTPVHHTIKISKTSNTLKKKEGDLKVQNSPQPLQLSVEGIKSITRLAERALPRCQRRRCHGGCIGLKVKDGEQKHLVPPQQPPFQRDSWQGCHPLTDSIQIWPPDTSLTWQCMTETRYIKAKLIQHQI